MRTPQALKTFDSVVECLPYVLRADSTQAVVPNVYIKSISRRHPRVVRITLFRFIYQEFTTSCTFSTSKTSQLLHIYFNTFHVYFLFTRLGSGFLSDPTFDHNRACGPRWEFFVGVIIIFQERQILKFCRRELLYSYVGYAK